MEKANVNGVQLAYTRNGQGKPLVLVHGYPLDYSIWDEVVSLLDNDFDIIRPDLRGFGESEIVEGQYKIVDMAADIAGLLDYLKVEKAALAGHSMGGYISLAFARTYPERIAGLGLIASQSLADTPERKQGRYEAAAEIIKTGVEPIAEAFSPKLTPDKRVQAFIHKLIVKQPPEGLTGALKAMAERDDSTSILSGFSFPVAILHGKLDELIPIERAQEMKALIPHAHLTELPDTGHIPMMEHPQATAMALRKLL